MSRSLVNQATADDEKPPGGFLLKELATKTIQSRADCDDIRDYLLRRVQDNSPDVRRKALMVIKYVAQHGRPEFRLDLQRNNELIKECTYFKGPPDPLRGDAPYQHVREAAKEALAAIFDAGSHNSNQTAGRIKGFGNQPTEAPKGFGNQPDSPPASGNGTGYNNTYSTPKLESGAYSTGKMQGFGNPAFEKGGRSDSWADRGKAPANNNNNDTRYTPYAQPAPYKRPEVSDGPSHDYGDDIHNAGGNAANDPHAQGPQRKRGTPGGVWGNMASAEPTPAAPVRSGSMSGSSGGFRGNSGSARPPQDPMPSQSRPVHSASSGEYEKRLVEDITPKTGIRPVPSAAELQEFCKKARSLDATIISELLQGKFYDNTPSVQVKALSVLRALLIDGLPGFREFFTADSAPLDDLANGDNRQVADMAAKVLVALGLREEERKPANEPVQSSNPRPRTKPSGSTDILNFGGDDAPATKQGDFDVFGDGAPQNGAVGQTTDMFAQLTVKSGPAAPAAGGAFPWMEEQSAPQARPAAAPAAAHNRQSSSSALNRGAPAPAPSNDPFSFMNESAAPPSNDPVADIIRNTSAPPQPYMGHPAAAPAYGYPPAAAYPYPPHMAPMYPPHMAPPASYYPAPYGYPPAAAPAPTSAPAQQPIDFRVQAAGNEPPRRRLDMGVLDSRAPAQSSSGFAFVNEKTDQFDFVKDQMKM